MSDTLQESADRLIELSNRQAKRIATLEAALREILHISREILTHGDPYDVVRIADAALNKNDK